jgi:putative transcriptional regulator
MSYEKSLIGSLLLATPYKMEDYPEREEAAVLICAHDETGSIGLIINKVIPSLYLKDLLSQLSLKNESTFIEKMPIFLGGNQDTGRGFVLHSGDYLNSQSILIKEGVYLTASLAILEKIAEGTGPSQNIVILGYLKWEKGELEKEIKQSKWLWLDATPHLIFDKIPDKWNSMMGMLVHNGSFLSYMGGSC